MGRHAVASRRFASMGPLESKRSPWLGHFRRLFLSSMSRQTWQVSLIKRREIGLDRRLARQSGSPFEDHTFVVSDSQL